MIKKTILFCLLFFAVSIISANAKVPVGCASDCKACHTFTKKEAEKMIKSIAETTGKGKSDTMKVTGISDSGVKGLWLVRFVDGSNNKGTFLVDYGKKNIIAGVVIPVGDILNTAKATSTAKVDMPRIPFADGSIIIGDIKSPKKILVFTNPDCPFCAKQHEIIKKVAAKRKDVVFFLKLKPFSAHWDAKRKSISILCNDSQSASLSMLVDAYSGKKIPDPAAGCSDKTVNDNIALAEKLGVKVVPTLIYEGKIHTGVLDEKSIENFIK